MNETVTPALHRHGEYVSPDYATATGIGSAAGRSTNADRPDGKVSGIVQRFAKNAKAAEIPTSLHLLKTSFQESIEFTGISYQTRGASILIGLFGALIALGMGWPLIRALTVDGYGNFFHLILLGIVLLFVAFGVKVMVRAMRVEFFRPEDEPIIFDRKHRRVYALIRVMQPGWKGLLKHWPTIVAEYDWNLIDAEHHAVVSATGSTIHRYHNLVFLVRRSYADSAIIDSFQVGNSLQVGADSAAPLWEHIRRFMEANGPHLPLGELPITAKAPITLWESMGAVGPLGPGYLRFWKDHPVAMIFFHLMFPFFLPMFLLWGLFNWLSYKTAISIQCKRDFYPTATGRLPGS